MTAGGRRQWRQGLCISMVMVAATCRSANAFIQSLPATSSMDLGRRHDVSRLAASQQGPDAELGAVLQAAGEGREKLDLKGVFDALTAPGSIFMEQYWQKKPCFISQEIPSLKEGWTMEDMEAAIAKEFLCKCSHRP